MGIPHLKRNLEPFAERGPIEPGQVAVDGPALVYHILGLCLNGTLKSSPFEQPPYQILGETALAWLAQVENLGFNMYFNNPPCYPQTNLLTDN